MGKSSPSPPDYQGAAREQARASSDLLDQQTRANRPNLSTPYATQRWEEGPDGQWNMTTGFQGETAALAEALRAQAAGNMATPMDWSQFGDLETGESARQQAIDATYAQATSRLDPQWAQREESARTRLLNQGLTEGSEAYRNAMSELGQQRNDAYSSAMNAAVLQGTQAGDSVFRNSMAARQQSLAEALRRRQMPMDELGQLQSQLALPGFQGAGRAQDPQVLQAAMARGNAELGAWQATNQANADAWNTGFQAVGTLASIYAMSDERTKVDVQRLEEEALPGVPLATFEYAAEPGQRYRGVIAQDVAELYPHLVMTGEDGLLRVHPSLAPEPLHG